MSHRPVVAISSCLLGQPVRYDGRLQHHPDICQHLQQHFNLLAICPETEIGLPVPRPPVQLTGNPSRPRMTGRDNPDIDITDSMRDYCQHKIHSLKHISGYVFKSRSPSCGLENIPVFEQNTVIDNNHAGLFADTVINTLANLPVTEETQLQTQAQRDNFISQVLDYYAQQVHSNHG
ncbi:MAG: DUF523 domain-containing protein [Gammaproteobacteria bacterium]|nr:DUF523 domain-containing protein [Gammaproteobacteria bacterium]